MANSRGSYLIGSTLTSLFALSLYAMVTYYSQLSLARQAVIAATHRVLRCVTATASDCLVSGADEDRTVEWYLEHTAPRALLRRDQFRYSGEYVEQQWELRGTVFEQLLAPAPQLILPTSAIPQRSFRAQLNRFERRIVHLSARGTRYRDNLVPTLRPVNEPNFPHFDLSFERARDRRPADEWYPLALSPGGELTEFPLLFEKSAETTTPIRSNSSATFNSPIIPVPTLPSAIPCLTAAGAQCSAATGNHDISHFASLAIKAFATITPQANRAAEVRWGDFGRAPGLEVVVWSAADVAAAKINGTSLPDRAPTCLGGRDWVTVAAGSTSPINLWLRGPSGSTGGSAPLCPDNRTSHTPIEVERGGAFQIRARLSTREAPIVATVLLTHFLETFSTAQRTASVAESFHCERTFPLRTDRPLLGCPAAERCDLTARDAIANCSIWVETVPVCEAPLAPDPEIFASSKYECPATAPTPYCVFQSMPKERPGCPAPTDRKICGWTTIADLPPLITPTPAIDCGAALNYGKAVHCEPRSQLEPVLKEEAAGHVPPCAAAQLMAANHEASTFERTTGLSLRRVTPADLRWHRDSAASYSEWAPYNGASDAPSTIRRRALSFPLTAPFLKRSESGTKPPSELFSIPEKWKHNLLQLTPTLVSETVRAVPQLSVMNPGTPTQCTDVEHSTALRALASAFVPALADPAIYFAGKAEKVDSVVLGVVGGCGEPSLRSGPCDRAIALEPQRCGAPLYLGRFSSHDFPEGPPQCHASTAARCFSIKRDSVEPPKPNVQQIESIAREELARALGLTESQCNLTQCLRVEVDRSEWPLVRVAVTLRHPHPPLLAGLFDGAALNIQHSASGKHETAQRAASSPEDRK